jgi:hypothetical protein
MLPGKVLRKNQKSRLATEVKEVTEVLLKKFSVVSVFSVAVIFLTLAFALNANM